MTYQTFDPTALSQPDLHAYLLAAIGPRPIAFASTVDREGRRNLAPFSFFNVFSSNPPIVVFSPARSGRDNTTKHTLDNVLEVPEVVINIVNYALVEQMSLASTAYPKGVDEFIKAGLKPIASQTVRPARVAEAPVALECSVEEVKALGDGPGAGNLIIARVLRIHIQKDYLDADGSLDSSKLDLVARMGGSWYCRAWGDALFEIPKPIRT
ncbi:MAG: flavin reductase family protein, partial [Bacteroidetes bacterium]